MKSILSAFILSLIGAVAIAQSPVQKQSQTPVQAQNQPAIPDQAVSSVGKLTGGATGGAAAASYAATGKVIAPTTNPIDSIKNAAERRRVEVLKSNKTGDPNAIAVNPLYTPTGHSGENPMHNPALRAINESGVSVKSNTKPKK
ncbi:hypothetical protein FBD94_06880 [Pedobacter hiemivivus]|uniref:DUF4148 domain-containing protein n=1 Tax=Pedobacter hiemivivus TaxID=2530454 RepID=A0A4U1GKY2_9SPHI|nr:hypothetical protein [Pedobacter hiemivivus]TKC64059.1 hypothetical protein FBD94_06880 [Pedobacter hiemivivus]